MNILIVKLSAIGDVIMSLPFLTALRKKYPEAHITWLVEEAASDVVLDHPLVDRVLVSRRKAWFANIKSMRPAAAWKEAGPFLKDLRDRKYDLVIDLQGLFKSGILTWISGGRRRIGFDKTRELSYLFLNEKLPAYDPDRHALLRYLDVAEYLGADVSAVEYEFPNHSRAVSEAEKLLQNAGRPFIAINPGAKWKTKLWPNEAWRELGRLLAADAGLQAVLTGSPDEAGDNKWICEGVPGAIDLTGRTGLKVLAEVFRAASLVACPDTGPMHLAAAVGTPIIALFGPTAPCRTGPYGDGHVVLRTGADCSPCFLKKCPDPHCMTDITPEKVYEVVLNRLETSEV